MHPYLSPQVPLVNKKGTVTMSKVLFLQKTSKTNVAINIEQWAFSQSDVVPWACATE